MIRWSAAFLLSAAAALPPVTALANEDAVATVRGFYENPDRDERDPSRFTDPALETLKRAAAEGGGGEESCVDFSFVFNAQDWDQDEVQRTLKLSDEPQSGGSDVVTADFSSFGEKQELLWTLQKVGDGWKVADVESLPDEWRLSDLCR